MAPIEPIPIGALILANVITRLKLASADREYVEAEVRWLFSAADNFLKIRRGEIKPDQPIMIPTPTDTEKVSPQATNRLLLSEVKASVKDWSESAGFKSLEEKMEVQLGMWEEELMTMLYSIREYLNELEIHLDEETQRGEAGKYRIELQNEIKQARLRIVQTLQEMALFIRAAYGIYVTSPEQLVKLLRG